jgi:ABC-2 type transport system permease protein
MTAVPAPTGRGVSGWLRLVRVGWALQLKLRSRSAFDGALSVVWPIFFATTAYFVVRAGDGRQSLAYTAVGSSVMGVWSAVTTTAASSLQQERWQGTLELLVTAPAPFAVLVAPLALAQATIGGYSLVATLLWARLVFGIHIPLGDPVVLIGALPLTVVSVGLFGFLLSIVAVRYRSAWALGNAVEYPVWLIAGFLIPLTVLPGWLHPVSWLLAPTWAVEALRAASDRGPGALADLGMCLLLSVTYAAIGALLARRILDSARRRATLALS